MLDFLRPEVVEVLKLHLRDLAVTFRWRGSDRGRCRLCGHRDHPASGKQIPPRP